jgi:hypothetical protein
LLAKSTSQNQDSIETSGDQGQCNGGRGGLINRLRSHARKADTTLDLIYRKVEFLARWNVSLATTILIVLIAIGVRYYYSFVTGYIVPDEAWYYDTFVLDRWPISSYREVFVAVFLFFFGDVHDVWTFLQRGALYCSVWAVGCVVLFFMILRRLETPESMSSLLILSLPMFPVFIVLSAAAVTETLALLMALVGVYFGVRHVQRGRIVDGVVSILFFFLAYRVREPYLLFVVGQLIFFLVLSLRRRALGSILVYAVLLAAIFPVPVQLEPLMFAQPVYALIRNLMSGAYQGPIMSATFIVPIAVAWHADLPRAVITALGYGFNPLFALFAVSSLFTLGFELYQKRSSVVLFLVLNAVLSFGASVAATSLFLGAFALPDATSAIIRTTHASLPSIAGFPSLYRRLGTKRVAALTIIAVIVGSTQLGLLAAAFQTTLSIEPVDRLNLDYRAPYYKMYLLARDSGKTLVFGGIEMRGIRMYMQMLPNVTLVPVGTRSEIGALNETKFQSLLEQGWDAIFLYDDWVTIAVPSMIDAYPQFYSNILRSKQYPGYTIRTLWVDGESYALRMVKDSNAELGSAPQGGQIYTSPLSVFCNHSFPAIQGGSSVAVNSEVQIRGHVMVGLCHQRKVLSDG